MSRFSGRASLQFTLSAVISLLAMAIVVTVTARLTERSNQKGESDLRLKALLDAEFFASQLPSAVAFNDRQTAHEVLASAVQLDRDLEGLALYRQDGSLIEREGGYAPPPWTTLPERGQVRVGAGTLDALAPVIAREGPRGVVVLRLSRAPLARTQRAALLDAAAVGAGALALALLAAWLIAGRVAGRLGRMATAANRVAHGDLSLPRLDPGAPDEIGQLVTSFNAMVAQLRQLIAQSAAAAETEQERLKLLVDQRTQELAARHEELQQSGERYRLIVETTDAIPWEYSVRENRFTYVGPQAEKLLGHPASVWESAESLRAFVPPGDFARLDAGVHLAGRSENPLDVEFQMAAPGGRVVNLRLVGTRAIDDEGLARGFLLDVTRRTKLEAELQQAQKLESVGRLASGIAHEINTPVQFVGDSVHFVQEAFRDTLPVLSAYQRLKAQAGSGPVAPELLDEVRQAEEAADLDFLVENVPQALERAVEGLSRVATLVRSMKEFAHPDQKEKAPADLNHALSTTLVIARNEYKYVADVEADFADLPPLLCHVSELNQVFLNLLVNAAHAIGEVVAGTEQRGVIRVATRREGHDLVVSISDTGSGIPAEIREKIFDPFFTTKPVGQGTGQGLAIAHSIVVDKHGGRIAVESTLGGGTTFTLRLPLIDEVGLCGGRAAQSGVDGDDAPPRQPRGATSEAAAP